MYVNNEWFFYGRKQNNASASSIQSYGRNRTKAATGRQRHSPAVAGAGNNAWFCIWLPDVYDKLRNRYDAEFLRPSGNTTQGFWDGQIDDLQITGRALSASEIQSLSSRPVTAVTRVHQIEEGTDSLNLRHLRLSASQKTGPALW